VFVIVISNNQYYSGHLKLGFMSYWLLRNTAQKLVSWTEEWKYVGYTWDYK